MGETLEELEAKVADLHKQNEEFNMENEMLADFLQRNAEQGAGLECSEEALMDSGGPADGKGRKGRMLDAQRKTAASQRHKQTSLTLEEKYRIAAQELEALHQDIEQTKKTSEQNLDILRALMEETDLRTAEVKRDAYEFRRDIVVGAENPRTGKTMAEKVLKYMEDKLTQKDTLINKLLMKNQAYKISIKQKDKQLRSKQETGDDLQYIDFHQLQIENQQFSMKIDEAYQELSNLKRTSGRTVKVLTNMKKRLSSLTAETKFLDEEIKERKAALQKTENDIVKVVEEKEIARKDNKKLKVQSRISPDMPQVVDYVHQKSEQHVLEGEKRNWEKKLGIAEMAAKQIRKNMRKSASGSF